MRSALVLFRLARHCEHNPAIVGYLVAITAQGMAVDAANAALQSGPVSKEVRDALDAELAFQERMEGFIWALKSGRAIEIDEFGTVSGRNFWLIDRGYWNQQESDEMDVFTALIALARDPSRTSTLTERLAIRHQLWPVTAWLA